MKQRRSHRRLSDNDPAARLYRSGESVPAGTYVSLDEGRFVHMFSGGELPAADPLPRCYVHLSDSPDYVTPLSLLMETAH